jgi:hypothetical protein
VPTLQNTCDGGCLRLSMPYVCCSLLYCNMHVIARAEIFPVVLTSICGLHFAGQGALQLAVTGGEDSRLCTWALTVRGISSGAACCVVLPALCVSNNRWRCCLQAGILACASAPTFGVVVCRPGRLLERHMLMYFGIGASCCFASACCMPHRASKGGSSGP